MDVEFSPCPRDRCLIATLVDDILEAVPPQETEIVEKTKPIPLRLPESLIKDLDEIAKELKRKRADVMRRFLIFSVKQYKARRKTPKRK